MVVAVAVTIGVPWRRVRVRMGGEKYEGWVNFHSSVVLKSIRII